MLFDVINLTLSCAGKHVKTQRLTCIRGSRRGQHCVIGILPIRTARARLTPLRCAGTGKLRRHRRNSLPDPITLQYPSAKRSSPRHKNGIITAVDHLPGRQNPGMCHLYLHGGALGSGAPIGNKNALCHGHYTEEAIARRRELAELIRMARASIAELDERS